MEPFRFPLSYIDAIAQSRLVRLTGANADHCSTLSLNFAVPILPAGRLYDRIGRALEKVVGTTTSTSFGESPRTRRRCKARYFLSPSESLDLVP